MLELNKVSATLTRDFELKLADPAKEWRYHTLFISIPSGWPCYIKRRGAVVVKETEKEGGGSEMGV